MTNQQEFFQRLTELKGGIPEPLHETTAVLSYEVGKMMEQAMYLFWFGYDPTRIGFYKSEVIDAIAQLVLICESLGINFEEMKVFGIEKALERFTGKEKK